MGSCLFCDIAAGKIPCTEVHSDEKFLAFRDIDPKAPTHILVIPRRHITSLSELQDTDSRGTRRPGWSRLPFRHQLRNRRRPDG